MILLRRTSRFPIRVSSGPSRWGPSHQRGFLPQLGRCGLSTTVDPEAQDTRQPTDEKSDKASTLGTGKDDKGWSLFPEDIVAHLSRHVVGQEDAKKATAIALRTRWRRMQLQDERYRQEVLPSNILMKGPTGSGKTEIARRLASLAEAPFVKVEATRYTEVGIVGENTSDMIKLLMDQAVAMQRNSAKKDVEQQARDKAEAKVLELLKLPRSEENRRELREGALDHLTVRVPPRETPNPLKDLLSGLPDALGGGLGGRGLGVMSIGMPEDFGGRRKTNHKQTISVRLALDRFVEELGGEMLNDEEIIEQARKKTEETGIVFIDEIDKLAVSRDSIGRSTSDAKGEGVQRELLTLVEGASVRTRYGPVRTDHILFVASGAFHKLSVADLLPELQGRFPVRVELKPLNKADLVRVLSEKEFNLVEQTVRLLGTEGLTVTFSEDGIHTIAHFAEMINRLSQDIGARRLNTVMHRVVEDLSFSAPRLRGESVVIDGPFVKDRLKDFDPIKKDNVAKYIL